MHIRHLIILVHPGCYEAIHLRDPEMIARDNLQPYLDRERMVEKRWRTAAASADQATLLLQVLGSKSLFSSLQETAGESRTCYLKADYPGANGQAEYHRRLTAVAVAHMNRFGMEMDPEQVTAELWGESFEGCVAGYGSAIAEQLGLQVAPQMRFDMTVFDATFLHEARRHMFFAVGGTDIEACVFELHDGTPAALFQSRLHAQWLDLREIWISLDPVRVQICTKLGHTVWPARPRQKGDDDEMVAYHWKMNEDRWIRGIQMGFDELRSVVASAIIKDRASVQIELLR